MRAHLRQSTGAPSANDLEELAAAEGIELAEGEAAELLPVVAALTGLDWVEERLADVLPLPRPAGRDPGEVPPPEENPFNAFIRRCHVRGAAAGTLAGLTVGLKDNIAVAGVPTTNASRLTPHVPAHDAVVVERILAAGGTITGKLNMDDFGSSGLGETSRFGPPRNPVDPSRSAGGSSGGSGAAVRAGAVDLALGVDQGGSGRIPASFCGVVAVKPTHGLVPSWGVAHIDHTIDHVTPLARTVESAARLLEVIAGEDWRDAQWVRHPPGAAAAYRDAEHVGVEGLRVGLVSEACDSQVCEHAVLENLGRVGEELASAGAIVADASIPLWTEALHIFLPYVAHLFAELHRSEGQGYGHLGAYDVDALRAYAVARREESSLLAPQVKAWLLADRFVHERRDGALYGLLHNARLALRRAVSAALDEFDILLTPTLPITAPELAPAGISFAEISARTSAALCMNTAPLNLTGHPAISVPSGVDPAGLPTGAQLVAAHLDEVTAFRAAFAVERAAAGRPAA